MHAAAAEEGRHKQAPPHPRPLILTVCLVPRLGDGAVAPAPRLLEDGAAQLRKVADSNSWELCYRDQTVLYIDSMGVVSRIRVWAEQCMKAAVSRIQATAPAPLVISGLVKVGCLSSCHEPQQYVFAMVPQ